MLLPVDYIIQELSAAVYITRQRLIVQISHMRIHIICTIVAHYTHLHNTRYKIESRASQAQATPSLIIMKLIKVHINGTICYTAPTHRAPVCLT